MNKENKLVPKLRFPEFVNDQGWRIKKLKQISELNPTSNNLPDSFVYIDLESVDSGILLKKKIISLGDAPSRAQRLLQDGDIIFQMVRPYQKNNYLFLDLKDNFRYVASTGYAQIRAYESNTYLYHYLHNELFVERVIAKCTGSNYPAINSSDLAEIFIEIPQLNEQQKIASCLSSLDELIAAHTDKLESLKDHKKGLMQQLFPAEGETVPKLRFKEFEKDGEWVEKSVQQLIDKNIIIGHLDGNHGGLYPKAEEFASEGIPYITANDFISGIVEFSRCKRLPIEKANKFKKGVAKNGDILFAHNATVGPVAKLETDLQYIILSTTATYFRCDNNCLINDFFKYCLISPNFVRQYTRIMAQSTRNQVPITAQRKLEIQMPSSSEQQKIANFLSSIDDEIAAQTQKIEGLKEHKKGLMQGLFPVMVSS